MAETKSTHQLWKPGQSGNPNGKPKGAISNRNKEWYALRDSVVGYHTEQFNEQLGLLWRNDPLVAMRMYLELLNYFKPKHASVSNYSGLDDEAHGLVLSLEGFTVPDLPSNVEPDDGEVIE